MDGISAVLNTSGTPLKRSSRLTLTIFLSVAFIIVATVSYFLGAVFEDLRFYQRGIDGDRRTLSGVLEKRPAYSFLQFIDYSAGQSWLAGTLASDEDYKQLECDVIDAFGRARLERCMANVSVERAKTNVKR